MMEEQKMKNLQIAKKTRLIILIFTIVLISVIGIIYYRTNFFNVEQATVAVMAYLVLVLPALLTIRLLWKQNLLILLCIIQKKR